MSADISSVAPGVYHVVMEKEFHTINNWNDGSEVSLTKEKEIITNAWHREIQVYLKKIPSSLQSLIYKYLAQFIAREKNKSVIVFPHYRPVCGEYFQIHVRKVWRVPMIIISLAMKPVSVQLSFDRQLWT